MAKLKAELKAKLKAKPKLDNVHTAVSLAAIIAISIPAKESHQMASTTRIY